MVALHRSDRIAVLGAVVTLAGTVLPWASQPVPATAALTTPWEVTGFVPGRAIILAVLALYPVVRITRRFPRVEYSVLGLASIVAVLYPPLRFSEAPIDVFVPGTGFYVTQLGGVLLAVAATLRYVEATGYPTERPSTGSIGAD